jgi:S-methylmethionine-dependent homocysteine/selenocysteine methylase
MSSSDLESSSKGEKSLDGVPPAIHGGESIMAKYRHALPQAKGGLFLSDGGMETALIFLQGQDLPQFASFVLLEGEKGRAELVKYYENFLPIARKRGLGFVLDTATWRASPDWGKLIGFDAERMRAINIAAVELVDTLRDRWKTQKTTPIVLNGAIGPRGDGYKAAMSRPPKRKTTMRSRSASSRARKPTWFRRLL